MDKRALVAKLSALVEEHLNDPSLFLVDVVIKGQGKQKVNVFIDGDRGVMIDQCVSLSRKLGEDLETLGWFDSQYVLEVSSPGVGQPLKLSRQYRSNIDRKIEVTTKEGKTHVGKLQEVGEEAIILLEEIPQKNKKNIKREERSISFEEITETNVLVSFK